MNPQYSHKVDQNQDEIVKALRKAGCTVHITAGLGGGFPDLLVGFIDELVPQLVLMEVKMPNGKLTEDEIKFKEKWARFYNQRYFVVRSAEQALKVIGKV